MGDYTDFLRGKIETAPVSGFDVDPPKPRRKEAQQNWHEPHPDDLPKPPEEGGKK